MKDLLEKFLKEKFQAGFVEVVDESHLHAGHKGAQGGGHFRVAVASPQFEGKSLMQRHRMVQDAAFGAFPGKIHALSIKAFTPQELLKRP